MRIKSFKFFYPERPRLLHIEQPLFSQLDDDPAWIAEPKFNGSRLQLHFINGEWQFWNRHGERMSYQPSREVIDALNGLNLKGYWLFDGELRHGKTKGVRHQMAFYDIFIRQDELLIGKPFEYRREVLETLLHYQGDYNLLSLTEQYRDDFRAVFDRITPDPEIEGLVVKNLGGKLNLGRTRAAESTWMWKVRKPNNSYHF
jgi:ATP-dependent DNA ligase